MPLISVIITTYNRANFLEEAIQSVLSSTFQDFEIIISDNCSTDGTIEIIEGHASKDQRIRFYLNKANLGEYSNRIKAASKAKGLYIKFLDADDLIYPNSLSIFVEGMKKYPSAALGISPTSDKIKGRLPILLSCNEAIRFHFLIGAILDGGPTCTIIRKDIFDELNGFKNERFVGDIDLWFRFAEKYPILILPHSLVYYREHIGQEIANPLAKKIYGEFSLKLYKNLKRQKNLFSTKELKVVKGILCPSLIYRIIEKSERMLNKLKYYFA
jgi:glycosyltransferase involved in cell wall biosynthesis